MNHQILTNAIEDDEIASNLDAVIKSEKEIYDYMTLSVECGNLNFLKRCHQLGLDLSTNHFGLIASAFIYQQQEIAEYIHNQYSSTFDVESFKNCSTYERMKQLNHSHFHTRQK